MPVKQLTRGTSKYKDFYCDELIEHMSKGLSFETFANTIPISPRILREWRKEHPEFQEAYRIGHTKRLEMFEKLGLQMIAGKSKGNASAWVFAMKAFFKHRENDDNKVNVQVNNINEKSLSEVKELAYKLLNAEDAEKI